MRAFVEKQMMIIKPTIFYEVMLCLALLGATTEANIYDAWVYVVLHVAHSLVHALGSKMERRCFCLIEYTAYHSCYLCSKGCFLKRRFREEQ